MKIVVNRNNTFFTTLTSDEIYNYDNPVEFERHSGGVYSGLHYVIQFGSDLQQVSGCLRFPQPIIHDIAEILLKVALNTITLTLTPKMQNDRLYIFV
jgi:hypothetical protein